MARPRMECLTLAHRLRVQDPWLKVLQQEQPVLLVLLQILSQQPRVDMLTRPAAAARVTAATGASG